MTYHDPVLLKESVDGLSIAPEGVYVDVTYGGGGHSKEILARLGSGKLVAFDQDEEAEQNKVDDPRLIFVRHNFRYISNFLDYYGIKQVDGILADLGVSSHQFDAAHRGFSFRMQGELDMRMNTKAVRSAKDIVNTYTDEELTRLFVVYGELPNARGVAKLICQNRNNEGINNIEQLIDAIRPSIPRHAENKFLAQVFQSLRIEVNDELGSLRELLTQSANYLKPGGRLSVITYHSLEDRLVKNFIKAGNFEGKLEKDFYGNVLSPFKAVNKDVIIPSEEEIARNNRARSAKLRVAVKLTDNKK